MQVNCDTGRHHHHRAVTWCRVLESLTTSYYSVYETVKLWRHGGSNTAPNVKPEVTIQVRPICLYESNVEYGGASVIDFLEFLV